MGGAMWCISCGGDTRVKVVEQDCGMKTVGYEHQTLECCRCHKTERRLAFSGERELWSSDTGRILTNNVAASLFKIYETLVVTHTPQSKARDALR